MVVGVERVEFRPYQYTRKIQNNQNSRKITAFSIKIEGLTKPKIPQSK